MKFLFYFSHPAQYLTCRETVKRLIAKEEHQVTVLIKTKDVLEELIRQDKIEFINIQPKERGTSKSAMILSLFKRIVVVLPIVLREKPDLLIGTAPVLAHVGWLLRINRITILEDDYAVIKNMADILYPFAQTILCPEVCDVGKWDAKKVGYAGYMKLGYLHPAVFSSVDAITDKYRIGKDFVLIRLSKLAAYHDIGISGIDPPLLDSVVKSVLEKGYRLYITSEGIIPERYKPYRLRIEPTDMHHILAEATLLISDSQSMSVEAAVLGVPSIRYSSLVGRLSVLNELQETYALTYGIPAGNGNELLAKINELLGGTNLRVDFKQRREKMLTEKINLTSFFVWFFENYPVSRQEMMNKLVKVTVPHRKSKQIPIAD